MDETREEQFLSGIADGTAVDLTPITRREHFLAKIAGQDVEIPDPITREEMLLKQIADNSGGGAKLDSLYASENGTYRAQDDDLDGYDEVTVDVPGASFTGLSVTENGIYTPTAGYDGFDSVTVEVSAGAATQDYTQVVFSASTVSSEMTLVSCSNPDDIFAAAEDQTIYEFILERIDAGNVLMHLQAVASMGGDTLPFDMPMIAVDSGVAVGGFIPPAGLDPNTSAATALVTVSGNSLYVAIANLMVSGTDIGQNVAKAVFSAATNATLTIIAPAVYEEPET